VGVHGFPWGSAPHRWGDVIPLDSAALHDLGGAICLDFWRHLGFSSLSLCFIFSLRFKKLHDFWVIFLVKIFPHCPFFHFLAFHSRMINELTNELTQYFQTTDAFCIYIPLFCRGLLFLFYLFVRRIFVWFHFTSFCGLEREAEFQLDWSKKPIKWNSDKEYQNHHHTVYSIHYTAKMKANQLSCSHVLSKLYRT